ncbi:MAG: DUF4317 family protein, partial [Alistipes sp.]|nr:DUF4317 family protein [Alistipes sp.]
MLFAAQSGDFIEKLRELGLVDITVSGWEPSEEDRQLLLDIEADNKALEFLKAWTEEREKAGQKGDVASRVAGGAAQVVPYASGREAFEHYLRAQREAAAAKAEIARLEKSADELRPWGDFDVSRVQKLADEGIVLRYFSAQRNTYDKASAEWSERYTISEIDRTDAMVWFVVIAAPGQEVNLDAQEMKVPQMDIRQAEAAIAAEQAKLETLDGDFARAAASRPLLVAYVASLKERLQGVKVEATARQAADGTLVVMEGWAETETSAKVDALLEEYFDRIIENYEFVGNYLILLVHDVYDVPGRTSDGLDMEDASDEIYEYILACICPVELSKPGLSYNPEENAFQNRVRDWV